MQANPKVIAVGDFLFFAPVGKAFLVPDPGGVVAAETATGEGKPGAADDIWNVYQLGTVKDVATDKVDQKPVTISSPRPGTGIIVPRKVVRTMMHRTLEVTMNEVSRLALAGFYRSELIEPDDDSFIVLSGSSIEGWLKVQKYDQDGEVYSVEDLWVDLSCEIVKGENNLLSPKFTFTQLYSSLAGTAI